MKLNILLTIVLTLPLAAAFAEAPVGQALLNPSSPGCGAWGCTAASISSDGNTAVLGAPVGAGVAFVFVNTSGVWKQVAVLTQSAPGTQDQFGTSVAISADANTIVIGAPGANSPPAAPGTGTGLAYVFVKPAGGWTSMTQTATLRASDILGAFTIVNDPLVTGTSWAQFGNSVAIGANGRTVLVGAPEVIGPWAGNGAAYLFVEPPAGWSAQMTETNKLVAADGTVGGGFGNLVAMDGNGDLVAITSNSKGYVAAQPETCWSCLPKPISVPPTLLPSTGVPNPGTSLASLAMSRDGQTIGVGYESNNGQGEAFVFVQPNPWGWSTTNEAAILTASDGVACDLFGRAIAVSSAGNTLLVGAFGHTALYGGSGPEACINAVLGAGAVYEFTRPAGGWMSQAVPAELYNTGSTGGSQILPPYDLGSGFGQAVAMSDSTATLLVAANNAGYIFKQKITPAISWLSQTTIYGTPLSGTQLDAVANVPGTFVYSPAAGTVLAAGIHTLSVTFTPTDSTDFTTVTATTTITVGKAAPTISWPKPAAIVYGTELSSAQLNATAVFFPPSAPAQANQLAFTPVAGTFVYSSPDGTLLPAGANNVSVTFTPSDTVDFTTATFTNTITVTKATPTITWPAPAPIVYGTELSATQLNASATVTFTLSHPPYLADYSVPGTFVYSSPAGTILIAGQHGLIVTFTPTDTADFNSVSASAPLTVNKATPTINWPAPAEIANGTALSGTQLNASATVAFTLLQPPYLASYNVPGSFAYSPAAGAKLSTGTHTLTVTFTPTDTADFNTATASVSIVVNAR